MNLPPSDARVGIIVIVVMIAVIVLVIRFVH
jgi:hypothetical protein